MKEKEKSTKIKKVVEKHARLNETKSHYYPGEHGGEEGAYQACSSRAVGKEVFWDESLLSWYYYL